MGPTRNTNTKRDTRSVDQLEEARHFKKAKQHQPDDVDPDDDDDYDEEHNFFEEDDDDDDGVPAVVNHTQTSKGSTSRRVIDCEDEDVGYEDHSKIGKKLSHSFSGSGFSSTPKLSSQKRSQISSHGTHYSADRHEKSLHKKRNTSDHFEKSVLNRIGKLEESVNKVVRLEESVNKLIRVYETEKQIAYKQGNASSTTFLTVAQKCNIGRLVRSHMFQGIKFLDDRVISSQGNKIFERCLKATNIDEVEDRTALFKAFISCARHYLNKHKGHVRRKIRAAATRKYLLNCLFSHDCNLINN